MVPDSHKPRPVLEQEHAKESDVELLLSHIDQTYAAGGLPGALHTLGEMLRRLDPAALKAMVYQLGLETEPPAEEEPDERRLR
ncbi:MAG TPA: hypothetical protein VGA42_08555 [Gemmatimonadales bacterium]|jgi:hypothetical protein